MIATSLILGTVLSQRLDQWFKKGYESCWGQWVSFKYELAPTTKFDTSVDGWPVPNSKVESRFPRAVSTLMGLQSWYRLCKIEQVYSSAFRIALFVLPTNEWYPMEVLFHQRNSWKRVFFDESCMQGSFAIFHIQWNVHKIHEWMDEHTFSLACF